MKYPRKEVTTDRLRRNEKERRRRGIREGLNSRLSCLR